MSYQPQGAGWWVASDGKWYPPELHPSYQPPVPPSKKPSRTPLLVGGIAVVIVITAATILLTRGGDDTEKASTTTDSTEQTESSDVSDDSDNSDSGSDTTGSYGDVTPIPAKGPTVEATGAGVSVTLPEGWLGVSLEEGVDDAGARLFPDDPDLAATIQGRMSVLPRAVVLFGVEEDSARNGGAFVPNLNVLPDPTAPSGLSVERIGRLEARGIEAFGGTLLGEDAVDLDGTDAYRIVYELKTPGIQGVAYVVKQHAKVWVLTYSFTDLKLRGDAVAMAEGSAATFK